MTRAKDQMVPALYRYFMAASLMRQEFDRHLKDPKELKWIEDGPMMLCGKAGLTMCLWYGMLFVVIEGWQEAKLSDPEINRLLTSPNVQLLKQFRNGMFHFQKQQWLSPKLSDFWHSPDSVPWVRALTQEFSRYFIAEARRISAIPAAPTVP